MKIPVFICTGFLDSGKTTLVKDTLMEQDWIEPGPTLLLLCEEGEEEYPEEYLNKKEMIVLKVDEFEQLNTAFFKKCEKPIARRRWSLNIMACGSFRIC